MNQCICCSDRLLRHLSHRRMYWFCPTCHQEMPSVNKKTTPHHTAKTQKLASLQKLSYYDNLLF